MKNKVLSTCLGISAILLSAGFFVQSITPAQAAPTPAMFTTEGTNQIGKYMMVVNPESAEVYEVVYVWNTETGESVRYAKKPSGYEKSTLQLPTKPL